MRRLIFAFGICFLVVLAVGACYAAWMIHRGFTTRMPPGAIETSLAASMRNAAFPSKYKFMRNPVTVTSDILNEGMEHWADHCSPCHANNGSGDTMYGKTMYPRPLDMRRKESQDMSDGRTLLHHPERHHA